MLVCIFYSFSLFIFIIIYHQKLTKKRKNSPGKDGAWAYLYATLCFFGGIGITAIFDAVLHFIQGKVFQHKSSSSSSQQKDQGVQVEKEEDEEDDDDDNGNCDSDSKTKTRTGSDSSSVTDKGHVVDVEQPPVRSTTTRRGAVEDIDDVDYITRQSSISRAEFQTADNNSDHVVGHGGHLIASLYENQEENHTTHDSRALIRMGIFAGIALAFHVRLYFQTFFFLYINFIFFLSSF